MAIRNVILVGATGNVGSEIYKALKASPANFSITILTRPDSESKQPEGAKVIQYDYTDPALVDALRGQDAVIAAVNAMATTSQIPLIDAAVKAGVKKFVPAEYGADSLNPIVSELAPWYGDKKTVHDHLVKVAAENPRFSYCALITGPFFPWGIKAGFLGYDLAKKTATIMDGGDLKISYTDIPHVALSVARALEKDASGYLHISSFTVSQNEILAALEKEIGEKFEVAHKTTEEYHETSEQMMQSEDPGTKMKGLFTRVVRVVYGEDCKGAWGPGDNAKLGLEELKLEDLVKEAVGKE